MHLSPPSLSGTAQVRVIFWTQLGGQISLLLEVTALFLLLTSDMMSQTSPCEMAKVDTELVDNPDTRFAKIIKQTWSTSSPKLDMGNPLYLNNPTNSCSWDKRLRILKQIWGSCCISVLIHMGEDRGRSWGVECVKCLNLDYLIFLKRKFLLFPCIILVPHRGIFEEGVNSKPSKRQSRRWTRGTVHLPCL